MRASAMASIGVLVTATSLSVGVTAANPAFANCGNGIEYDITGYTHYFLPAGGTHYEDGPGGTMTVTVEKATTVTESVSASVEVSMSDLFTSVKGTVGTSVEKSNAITTGHQYSHKVPAHKYGNLEYGSHGYDVNFSKVRTSGTCTVTTLGKGTIKVPTDSEGWRYWTTDH